MNSNKNQPGILIRGAKENNLKNITLEIPHGKITMITGVSGSGKSSLAFDTLLAEAKRRFFSTLSHYSRQYLDAGSRPKIDQMKYLLPGIGMVQRETNPNARATIASTTDIGELLGTLMAKFGTQQCPQHQKPTAKLTMNEICSHLQKILDQKEALICAPIATKKKGHFKKEFQEFNQRGYRQIIVNDVIYSLSNPPAISSTQKNTIKAVIDHLIISQSTTSRLFRSVQTALNLGKGILEVLSPPPPNQSTPKKGSMTFSLLGGCGQCGFSWPSLDPRYFSTNSLGQCSFCLGLGECQEKSLPCCVCKATGLNPDLEFITFSDLNILSMHRLPMAQLLEELKRCQDISADESYRHIINTTIETLEQICRLKLGYLSLHRRIKSLSDGEVQRLKMAKILGESLRNILYVFDEPSTSLHPQEIEELWTSLTKLKAHHNTIVIVDHNEIMLRKADLIIDLGPGGGQKGGQITAIFSPPDCSLYRHQSSTAKFLSDKKEFIWTPNDKTPTEFIVIRKPTLHHLTMDEVRVAKNALNLVTGKSGAGKTSLIIGVLGAHLNGALAKKEPRQTFQYCESIEGLSSLKHCHILHRKVIGKHAYSFIATYLGVFSLIKDLYCQTTTAKILGVTPKSLKIPSGEFACHHCSGKGTVTLSMSFLPDTIQICPICKGGRFLSSLAHMTIKGLNLAQVLRLTITESLDFFTISPRIRKKLQTADNLGLGYLSLGQPIASLSGGEAQRIQLAHILSKKISEKTLLILDEPSSGLHVAEVKLLTDTLREYTKTGLTTIVIDHHRTFMESADWIIELGPHSGHEGGKITFSGTLQDLKIEKNILSHQYFFQHHSWLT